MSKRIEQFENSMKNDLPEINVGDKVKVWQKIGEDKDGRERITPFTGVVISRKHGKETGSTVTVRGEVQKIAVEKIFPLHSPTIKNIEIISRHKVRRSKLYFLRERKGKGARLRRKD